MTTPFKFLAFGAAALLLANGAHANLIVNGDFEMPPGVPANDYVPLGAYLNGSDWKVVGTSGVNVHHVNAPAYFNNTQFLDLSGNTGGGGIAQTFTTTIGSVYTVTFDALNGSLANSPTPYTGLAFTVQAGSSPALSYSTLAALGGVGPGTPLLYTFTANSTTTTLTFMDITNTDSNANWIDNVDVEPSAVPDGGKTALLLGMAMLGTVAVSRAAKFRQLSR